MESRDTINKLIEIINIAEAQGNYEADFDQLRNDVNAFENELVKERQKFDNDTTLTYFTVANQSNLKCLRRFWTQVKAQFTRY